MPVTTDIVESYRAPRRVVRRWLAGGRREDRGIVILMAACGLIFVAQWPRLSREAFIAPEIPLDARLGAALLGWLFLAPLLLYLVAALTHLLLRGFGGAGSGFGSRFALFWALLAASPLWLLHGLVAGFVGPSPALDVVGVAALGAFLYLWVAGLVEVHRGAEST